VPKVTLQVRGAAVRGLVPRDLHRVNALALVEESTKLPADSNIAPASQDALHLDKAEQPDAQGAG
jgi:hypothetical protein